MGLVVTVPATVRAEWVFDTVAEFQRFLGAWLCTDASALEHEARLFASRLTPPSGSFEARWLRSMLLELANTAGLQLHSVAHARDSRRCGFVPSRSLEPTRWIDEIGSSPVDQFTRWSGAYVAEISRTHSIFAATRAALLLGDCSGRPIRTSDLAALVRCRESTLRSSFKLHFGMSVREWQSRQRILHALRRLRDGTKADAVAFDVGFRRPSKFYSCFRRLTGCTPSALREQLGDVSDADLGSLLIPARGAGKRRRKGRRPFRPQ